MERKHANGLKCDFCGDEVQKVVPVRVYLDGDRQSCLKCLRR